MAKGLYVGVAGKARKVKKIYVGIGGKARRVKKGYVGVGGKARLFWSGGELDYYGTATPLSGGGILPIGVSIGSYALFACGRSNPFTTTSDLYNTSLVHSTIVFPDTRYSASGGSIGNHALVAGGFPHYKTVIAYNTSLVYSYLQEFSHEHSYAAVANVGDFLIFAGGSEDEDRDSSYDPSNYVDIYNTSLVHSNSTNLHFVASYPVGASTGNYAMIAGDYKKVGAFNSSLVYTSYLTDLSTDGIRRGGAQVGGYALFTGGYTADTNVVNAYNKNLVHSNPMALSTTRTILKGLSIEGYALFAGGQGLDNNEYFLRDTVDAYNVNLVRSILPPLSEKKAGPGAAVVGDYALIAGGGLNVAGSNDFKSVDVYTA